MERSALIGQIKEKRTFLCVGLDSDVTKLPAHLNGVDDLVHFNKAIIDATLEHCVAYKINTAFYEALGVKGWQAMEETIRYIPSTHLIIADAKRGDIGNTSKQYARAFFQSLPCDAITVAPYMGEDSVSPFLGFPGKWVIVLALTSNPGSGDFQLRQDSAGRKWYQEVMRKVASWGDASDTMFVVGATQPGYLASIRNEYPEHFFLVPGVGAQGGDLQTVAKEALNQDVGLLVNASRSIIFASTGTDFAEAAGQEAARLHEEMAEILDQASR